MRMLRKHKCCSAANSCTRADIAVNASAGVSPSGSLLLSPSNNMALSRATRTIKNSSRLALKIARNFTRSKSGTLSSLASSSTRRLNSNHDNSRLI